MEEVEEGEVKTARNACVMVLCSISNIGSRMSEKSCIGSTAAAATVVVVEPEISAAMVEVLGMLKMREESGLPEERDLREEEEVEAIDVGSEGGGHGGCS